MRFWPRNNSLPIWLKAGAFLLRPEVHQQLITQHGYLNNTSLALDQLSLRLFALQHPPPIDRNHSQPLYSNQMISPVAMFTAIVMLHTFTGSSTPVSRHVRRETLRQFDLDEFRQRLLPMHRQLSRDLSFNRPQWQSVCLHSQALLHSSLPLNHSFLTSVRPSFAPLLHTQITNLTTYRRSTSKRHVPPDPLDSLCSTFVRDSSGSSVPNRNSRFLLHQWIQMQDRWSHPFNALFTHRHLFHNLDGSSRSMLFMELRAYVHLHTFAELSNGHVLRLPYASGACALYLIGGSDSSGASMSNVHEQVRSLSAITFGRILTQIAESRPSYAQVRLPRFQLRPDSLSMSEWLPKVTQITHPFHCDYVNFRALLNESRSLCLFDWTHRTRLSIDELGSGRPEVAGFYGDQHQNPSDVVKQVTFDRPFVVVVRNERLKATVMIGSVNHL
jgi:serine protease inhibitor